MPSTCVSRVLACLGIALALSLLPTPAAAAGLLNPWSGEGGSHAEKASSAAPESGLWSAVWGLLRSLGLVEPPPTTNPPPGTTDASGDGDQGTTLDPNG
jgi:hypothetical protein